MTTHAVVPPDPLSTIARTRPVTVAPADRTVAVRPLNWAMRKRLASFRSVVWYVNIGSPCVHAIVRIQRYPTVKIPRRRSTARSIEPEQRIGRRSVADRLTTQQSGILRLDGGVAFARGSDQSIRIGDLDVAAAVVDEVRLLQGVCDQRHAVAAGADHLRHRLLGQDDLVAAGEVAHVQQATRQPRLHGVRCVAAGSLLDLGVDGEPVPDQRRAKRRALAGGGPQRPEFDHRGEARHQHRRVADRTALRRTGRMRCRCCRGRPSRPGRARPLPA